MSAHAAHVRSSAGITTAVEDAWKLVRRMPSDLTISAAGDLLTAFRAADLALTHAVYLEAIREYIARGGQSRGSALVLNASGRLPCEALGDDWRFLGNEPGAPVDQRILEIAVGDDGGLRKEWVDIRPIPEENEWFETVWNDHLSDRIIR
jgi:hypothetical protein